MYTHIQTSMLESGGNNTSFSAGYCESPLTSAPMSISPVTSSYTYVTSSYTESADICAHVNFAWTGHSQQSAPGHFQHADTP